MIDAIKVHLPTFSDERYIAPIPAKIKLSHNIVPIPTTIGLLNAIGLLYLGLLTLALNQIIKMNPHIKIAKPKNILFPYFLGAGNDPPQTGHLFTVGLMKRSVLQREHLHLWNWIFSKVASSHCDSVWSEITLENSWRSCSGMYVKRTPIAWVVELLLTIVFDQTLSAFAIRSWRSVGRKTRRKSYTSSEISVQRMRVPTRLRFSVLPLTIPSSVTTVTGQEISTLGWRRFSTAIWVPPLFWQSNFYAPFET